jgi:hypothetical protein
MDACSGSWGGKESIIFRSLLKTKGENALKGFMLRFLSMLMEFELKRASTFIIKMATHLITNLTILSAYKLLSTKNDLKTLIEKLCVRTWNGSGRLLPRGMDQRRVLNGTENMAKMDGKAEKRKSLFVLTAELCTQGLNRGRGIDSALTTACPRIVEQAALMMSSVFVSIVRIFSASINTPKASHAILSANSRHVERRLEKVYNITVEGDNVYYANGILVGNCDALAYVQQIGTRPFGAPNEVMTTTEQEFWKNKKSKTKSLRNRF